MKKMPRASWLALIVAVVASVGAALVTLPASAAVAKNQPPKSGHWKLVGTAYSQDLLKGTFDVTAKHKAITHLTTTGGAGIENTCGTGVVKVIGKQAIIHVSGQTTSGTYSRWIVGKRTPDGGSPFGPKKVVVSHHGKRSNGTLELSFDKAKGGADTFGEISFGKCQFEFGFTRSH